VEGTDNKRKAGTAVNKIEVGITAEEERETDTAEEAEEEEGMIG
jgi:hypothetical protein